MRNRLGKIPAAALGSRMAARQLITSLASDRSPQVEALAFSRRLPARGLVAQAEERLEVDGQFVNQGGVGLEYPQTAEGDWEPPQNINGYVRNPNNQWKFCRSGRPAPCVPRRPLSRPTALHRRYHALFKPAGDRVHATPTLHDLHQLSREETLEYEYQSNCETLRMPDKVPQSMSMVTVHENAPVHVHYVLHDGNDSHLLRHSDPAVPRARASTATPCSSARNAGLPAGISKGHAGRGLWIPAGERHDIQAPVAGLRPTHKKTKGGQALSLAALS